jgi:glycosyltransferase involved in cell wall biosynthesis
MPETSDAKENLTTITVCVAVYNAASFIEETLSSILCQQRPPDEVVVVDDGSSDNTVEVVSSISADIKVISIKNSGPEIAKKTAIEAARCDFVCLCDHDDLWEVDHLERLELLIQQYPEMDFAFSNFEEFGPEAKYPDKFASMGDDYWDGPEIDQHGFQFWGPDNFERILHSNAFFPSSGIFKRTLYEKIGGIRANLSNNQTADADMTRRFAIAGNLAVDHHRTVCIRKHEDNFSRQTTKGLIDRVEILADNIEERGVFEPYVGVLNESYVQAAKNALWSAYYERDPVLFRRAGQHLPFTRRCVRLMARSVFMAIVGFYAVFTDALKALWTSPGD